MKDNDDLDNLKEMEEKLKRITDTLVNAGKLKEIIKKFALGGFVTLIGGWITTYLYEKFKLDNKMDGFFNFISTIPTTISDKAVENAINSRGFPYFSIIFTMLCAVTSIFLVKEIFRLVKLRSKLKIFTLLWNCWLLVSCIYSFFFFFTNCYANITLVPHVENRIEILAPYISDQDYKELKSEYYSINTNRHMLKFRAQITKKEKALGLPSDK